MDFIKIWDELLQYGASPRKEEGTRRYWETLTPLQQEHAFTTITYKIRTKQFVHYDPIRAIRDNLPRDQPREPVFLHGDEPDAEVRVRYNGRILICSRQTMDDFGLEYYDTWKK